jgi:hypothetical protein
MWAWDGGVQAGPGIGPDGARLTGVLPVDTCRTGDQGCHDQNEGDRYGNERELRATHPGADERPITGSQRQADEEH